MAAVFSFFLFKKQKNDKRKNLNVRVKVEQKSPISYRKNEDMRD
jgi:hypothetical protein